MMPREVGHAKKTHAHNDKTLCELLGFVVTFMLPKHLLREL